MGAESRPNWLLRASHRHGSPEECCPGPPPIRRGSVLIYRPSALPCVIHCKSRCLYAVFFWRPCGGIGGTIHGDALGMAQILRSLAAE